MNATQARYWYKHIITIADEMDKLNTANPHASLMYETGNEGLRRIAQEMLAHTEQVTKTDEIPVVDLGEAS